MRIRNVIHIGRTMMRLLGKPTARDESSFSIRNREKEESPDSTIIYLSLVSSTRYLPNYDESVDTTSATNDVTPMTTTSRATLTMPGGAPRGLLTSFPRHVVTSHFPRSRARL